jgi:hypothetical protein
MAVVTDRAPLLFWSQSDLLEWTRLPIATAIAFRPLPSGNASGCWDGSEINLGNTHTQTPSDSGLARDVPNFLPSSRLLGFS